jgi:toxin secretion/phage lysis holin
LKKALIFALVAVAGIADRVIPAANGAVRAAVILFYTANEAISILENAARLGLPVPEKLKNTLEKAKDSSGKGEGD